MNGGLVGLLLSGVALGVASVACWRFMLHPVTRWLPALLTLAYYGAMYFWPHQAIVAARTHMPYPQGDQVRALLFGLTFMLVMVELTVRLKRSVRNNEQLRVENECLHRELEGRA